MSHVHHESLPGFRPDQLLHDGCPECEQRARNVGVAISHLDTDRFERAWTRASVLLRDGLSTVSSAELPMLEALAAVQVQFERRGLPLGRLPDAWRGELVQVDGRVLPLNDWIDEQDALAERDSAS